MNIQFSIIVPVYNARGVLERCLASVGAQSFEGFECILVDDGSTDGAGVVCEEAARGDSRFRVFHKENGGVSSARNFGLERARGEWIAFVDADDWLDEDYLRNFVESPFLQDDVMLFQGWKTHREKRGQEGRGGTVELHPFREFGVSVKDVAQNRLLECWNPWGKLFNRNKIEWARLRFDESLSLGEDTVFFFKYLAGVRELKVLPQMGYNYRIASGGGSLSKRPTPWEVHYAGSVAITQVALPIARRFLRGDFLSRKRFESLLLFEQHALRLETLYRTSANEGREAKYGGNGGGSFRKQVLRETFGRRFELLKVMTPLFSRNWRYRVLWMLFMVLPIGVMDGLLKRCFGECLRRAG